MQAAAGKGIVIQIAGDGESAKRALQMVQEELRRLEEQKRRTAESVDLNRAFNLARSAVAVTGLTLSVGGLFMALRSVVGGALQLGETLEKASKRTGLQVETLSTLHYIAAITNQDFEGMTSAVSKMDKTIGGAITGNKQAAAVMQELGLNAKDLASRSDGAEIAFKTLTARIAATENPIAQVKLATDTLSKAGAQQIPMLIDIGEHWDSWVAKAKEAGVYLDGAGAAALARENEQMNELKQQVEGAGLAFTKGLIPGLQSMFGVINSGKGEMSAMEEFGNLVGRGLNVATAAAYGTAAGMAKLLQLRASLAGHSADADSWARVANDDDKQSHDAMFFAVNGVAHGAAESRSAHSATTGPHATGDPGLVGAPGKPGKSTNPIAEAMTALQQEQAKAAADLQKARDQAELAEWETHHKLLLASDQDFYKKKFDLQNDELDAEQEALDKRSATLEALEKKQHGDKLLKRDKDGNSAEQLKTQRELVLLQEQQGALTAKRQENESRYNGEVGESNLATELAGLRAAAALERERNSGITAQIALIRREHELEAQKSTNAGGSQADADNIKATGELAVQKLELQQVEQAIVRTEDDHSRVLSSIADQEQKGTLNKRAAAQQTREANQAAIQGLQQEAEAFRALAAAIGDPTLLQKAKDLDEQIATLGRTDKRGTFGKEFVDGMQGITTSIVDSAARGKQSVGDMARSILDDLDRMALKMAEEKWILPLFQSGFGLGGGSASAGAQGGGFGGAFGMPSLAGAQLQIPGFGGGGGPSIYKPPTSSGGGFGAAAGGIAAKIAESAASSAVRTPKVTSNLINQSSQPLSSGPPQVTYDESMKEFVISTVVQNHSEGGILSQLQMG